MLKNNFIRLKNIINLIQIKILRILLILVCWSIFSFAQTNQNIAPTFPKIKSSITMPVRIPLQEIRKMVNNSVKDLIFEDNSFTDNNNDQFKIKVWKTRDIRLVGGTQQNLLIEVPLKIWAQKGIGTLGVYSYQETTFETVMYFNTSIAFLKNWTVATTTKPNGFKWISKPVLDFGSIKIPITPLVEKSLKTEQQKFCATIDNQMKAQLNFQENALMAWNLFTQPFHISEDYNTWLKVTPDQINITPLKFYLNAIDATIGIDVYSETFTGAKPEASKPIMRAPDFSVIPVLADQFVLQTTANIPYSEATAMAQKMFVNKEFDFREGKSKVKVVDIEVYGKNNEVIIEIETEGALKGNSIVSGVPVYDVAKRKIVLKDTRYQLKTSNILYKTAVLFFKGKITKMIEEEYGIPTAEIEDYSKKSTEEAFNKDYYKGLKINGKVLTMKPTKVLVGKDGLTAVIDMNARLKLLVQGM